MVPLREFAPGARLQRRVGEHARVWSVSPLSSERPLHKAVAHHAETVKENDPPCAIVGGAARAAPRRRSAASHPNVHRVRDLRSRSHKGKEDRARGGRERERERAKISRGEHTQPRPPPHTHTENPPPSPCFFTFKDRPLARCPFTFSRFCFRENESSPFSFAHVQCTPKEEKDSSFVRWLSSAPLPLPLPRPVCFCVVGRHATGESLRETREKRGTERWPSPDGSSSWWSSRSSCF
jgi:hypothetical protein